ncbi:hypothetical protein [Desulfosporosinus orientis]|uniref:hypothetical protein n=1 Tax=Desulfosporosinus orientis TaxID=1563 RepID=UPI0005A6465C|nr:hypothetical protein [Desulfosporosinus orientis]
MSFVRDFTITLSVYMGISYNSHLVIFNGYGKIYVGSRSRWKCNINIEPSYMQIMYSLDPVVASLLGFVVFRQSLNASNIAGICLIIGVVIYVRITENFKDPNAAHSI